MLAFAAFAVTKRLLVLAAVLTFVTMYYVGRVQLMDSADRQAQLDLGIPIENHVFPRKSFDSFGRLVRRDQYVACPVKAERLTSCTSNFQLHLNCLPLCGPESTLPTTLCSTLRTKYEAFNENEETFCHLFGRTECKLGSGSKGDLDFSLFNECCEESVTSARGECVCTSQVYVDEDSCRAAGAYPLNVCASRTSSTSTAFC